MRFLSDHLTSVRAWSPLADEVVVVDSDSSDGTVEFIQDHLPHPRLRIVRHPPGLYASWNAGVRSLTTEFAYVSTVGDSVTPEGLRHLLTTATALACDVLLSSPEMVDDTGHRLAGEAFAIGDWIRDLRLDSPRVLSTEEVVIQLLTRPGDALTGSCASDLFRRDYLANHPFPTDQGTIGDAYWSVTHACRAVWAITPRVVSQFRRHETFASRADVEAAHHSAGLDALTRNEVEFWLNRRSAPPSGRDCHSAALWDLLRSSMTFREAKRQFDIDRASPWPWYLRIRAWGRRRHRQRAGVALDRAAAIARSEAERAAPVVPTPDSVTAPNLRTS